MPGGRNHAAIGLLLPVLAAVCLTVAVRALDKDHRCSELRAEGLHAPTAALAGVAGRTLKTCGDPLDRAAIDVSIFGRHRQREAAGLARAATRSTPQDWVSWLVRYRVTGEPAALREAQRLNPRGAPRR